MKTLILIPARAGSKGLPGKNVKILGDKPLISYTMQFASRICKPGDRVCITTNDEDVMSIAQATGYPVDFKRPEHLASDTAGSYDVMLHALKFFRDQGEEYDRLLLLQPTSPFRTVEDYEKMEAIFDESCDMVVSVRIAKDNPYFNLFEETEDGYLRMSKESSYQTRQQALPVYAYNGSIYLIRVASLLKSPLSGFQNIRKFVMPEERSVDIDTIKDWLIAEYYLKEIVNENS